MKRLSLKLVMIGVVAGSAVALARPVLNISAQRHPNLAAAQKLSSDAWDKVAAAQQANEGELGGHAQKAKELLEQVNAELKLAAEVSNANGH